MGGGQRSRWKRQIMEKKKGGEGGGMQDRREERTKERWKRMAERNVWVADRGTGEKRAVWKRKKRENLEYERRGIKRGGTTE